LLQSGGEGVAEELASLIKKESLASVEGTASGSLPSLLLQLGSQIEGHLGNLTLQRRLGLQRRFGHHPSS
jgi:hypothetical protein